MAKFRPLIGRSKQSKDVSLAQVASPQYNLGTVLRNQKVSNTGIKTLHEPEAAIADVVFVHGLTGDREKTWKTKTAVSPWPQSLLPAKVPQVRVLTFGYDANVADWRGMVSKNTIGDHAGNLLNVLATYRENDETNHRPIFFVAHSLGGLVCEDALLGSKNSADEHLRSIVLCTKGILFLGTPHTGAGLAKWAELMAKSIGFIKQSNSQIIQVLEGDSEVLSRIQTEFHTMLRARAKNGDHPIDITCFFEELGLPGIGIVVPVRSATLCAYPSIGIHSNHKDMARFEAEDDPGFVSIAGQLQRWVRQLSEPSGILKNPTVTTALNSKVLFTVPFDQDFKFIGRDDIISEIDERFLNSRRVALAGTGGVGKSQIAIEYCYRFRETHPTSNVLWIYCATVDRYKQAYQDIARKLSLPGWDDPKTDVMKIVSEWLGNENHAIWLMILDNADDNEKFFPAPQSLPEEEQIVPLVSYLPRTSNGFILVTTRDNRVGRRLTDSRPISVLPFDLQKARQLLQSKLPDIEAGREILVEEDVECLLLELECLPLAITQAAAFINENSISVAKYVRMLQDDNSDLAALLDRGIPDLRRDSQASNSVLQTWKLSFDQIRNQQPRAAEMLSLMAFFDPQSIPRCLLQFEKERESEFVIACGILQAFSLISVINEAENFSLHRLVQLFTVTWLDMREERSFFQEQALRILSKKYPTGAYDNWKMCTLLAPHVQVILSYHPTTSKPSFLRRAQLLYNLACFEVKQGRYESALQACKEAIEIHRSLLNEYDIETLHSLGLLGLILTQQGKWDEAELCHRQILTFRENSLGKEHPHTVLSMTYLAQTLTFRGKYSEAEILQREIFLLYQKRYGNEHPDTLTTMNNLARVIRMGGRHNEAEIIYRQALKISERVLGKEHPDTLMSMSDLAVVLQDHGQYDEAETMIRRTLRLTEKVLGADHSDTLLCMNNLAQNLQNQGKYDETEMMNRRILRSIENIFGNEHPLTLTSMHNLAVVLQYQNQYREAEVLMRKTVEMSEKTLGVEHADTLESIWALGIMLCLCDRSKEGYDLCQNAHTRLLKALGDKHPDNLDRSKKLDRMSEKMKPINDEETKQLLKSR